MNILPPLELAELMIRFNGAIGPDQPPPLTDHELIALREGISYLQRYFAHIGGERSLRFSLACDWEAIDRMCEARELRPSQP